MKSINIHICRSITTLNYPKLTITIFVIVCLCREGGEIRDSTHKFIRLCQQGSPNQAFNHFGNIGIWLDNGYIFVRPSSIYYVAGKWPDRLHFYPYFHRSHISHHTLHNIIKHERLSLWSTSMHLLPPPLFLLQL